MVSLKDPEEAPEEAVVVDELEHPRAQVGAGWRAWCCLTQMIALAEQYHALGSFWKDA